MQFDIPSGLLKLIFIMRNTLNMSLSSSLRRSINRRVESGRYQSAGEVVREALRLLDERDRSRHARLTQLKAEIAIGLRQTTAGELRNGQDVLRRILENIKSSRRNMQDSLCSNACG